MYTEENCPHLYCRDCNFYNVKADMEGVESTCKRIDHKVIQFAIPWFKTYDCNSTVICRDFEPRISERHYEDYSEWTTTDDYIEAYLKYWYPHGDREDLSKKTVAFVLNKDRSIRYHVPLFDYINGTMIEGNKLKAIYKMYYRRPKISKSHSYGYELVREPIDGVVFGKFDKS